MQNVSLVKYLGFKIVTRSGYMMLSIMPFCYSVSFRSLKKGHSPNCIPTAPQRVSVKLISSKSVVAVCPNIANGGSKKNPQIFG